METFELKRKDVKSTTEVWKTEIPKFRELLKFSFTSETLSMEVFIYNQKPKTIIEFLDNKGKVMEIRLFHSETFQKYIAYHIFKHPKSFRIIRCFFNLVMDEEEIESPKKVKTYNDVLKYILNGDFREIVD